MSDFRDEVESFWDSGSGDDFGAEHGFISGNWPQAVAQQRFAGELAQVKAWIAKYTLQRRRCLDIGCGTGIWLSEFSEIFEEAIGTDISPQMIRRAQHALKDKKNARAQVGSFEELGVEGPFDFVFVGGVLMYLEDQHIAQALQAIRQLASPGALVIFRETCYRGPTFRRTAALSPGLFGNPEEPGDSYRAIYRNREELRSHIEDAGLQIRVSRQNRHYKLSDMSEDCLLLVNRLKGGSLSTDRPLAERWARRIHRFRHLSLVPYYYLSTTLRLPRSKVENHWMVCTAPTNATTAQK